MYINMTDSEDIQLYQPKSMTESKERRSTRRDIISMHNSRKFKANTLLLSSQRPGAIVEMERA